MTKLITGITYPSGWHYIEGEVRVDADDNTYEGLIRALRIYRAQNRIIIGDIEGDIERQLCAKNPSSCHQSVNLPSNWQPQNTAPSHGPSHANLAERIADWAFKIIHDKPSLVDQSEAERRANICTNCPMNAGWEGLCGVCVAKARPLVVMARQNKPIVNNGLLGCHVFGQDNATAVWLNKDQLPQDQYPGKPGACWR